MKLPVIIALVFASFAVRAGVERSAWEIVKMEAAPGRPGYLEFTVCNVSEQVQEVAEDPRIGGAASANICLFLLPEGEEVRAIPHHGCIVGLIAEPCHRPMGFLAVDPGESVKAILPRIEGFEPNRLGFVLNQKKGKVVIRSLAKEMVRGRQGAAPKR